MESNRGAFGACLLEALTTATRLDGRSEPRVLYETLCAGWGGPMGWNCQPPMRYFPVVGVPVSMSRESHAARPSTRARLTRGSGNQEGIVYLCGESKIHRTRFVRVANQRFTTSGRSRR